jgi:hypothetical protein
VEPQFALFFLQRLAGKLNETDDLYSLDPELYRHLTALKRLKRDGSVAELSLNFEVVTGGAGEDEGGEVQQVTELVPGGKHVAVTNENVFRYIQLVANHRLNVEINAQVRGVAWCCVACVRALCGVWRMGCMDGWLFVCLFVLFASVCLVWFVLFCCLGSSSS